MAEDFSIDEGFVLRGAARIKATDLTDVVANRDAVMGKFDEAEPLTFRAKEAETVLDMLADFESGTFQDLTFHGLSVAVFALAYVIRDVDVIPDFIPEVGFQDDAAVVGIALEMIKDDLSAFKAGR